MQKVGRYNEALEWLIILLFIYFKAVIKFYN